MARITVHDCLQKVPNRFELALLAAERARQISNGEERTLLETGEPRTLGALREIAAGTVDPDRLRDRIVSQLQRRPFEFEPDTPPKDDGFEWAVVGQAPEGFDASLVEGSETANQTEA